LADPALAWCSQQGFAAEEYVATVETAAKYIIRLAKVAAPLDLKSIHHSSEDKQQAWEQKGELLLAALRAQDDLQRLAALTGHAWQPNGTLPWDTHPMKAADKPIHNGGPPAQPTTDLADEMVRGIIKRDRAASEAEAAAQQEAAERERADPLKAIRGALDTLSCYQGSPNSTAAAFGWCERLAGLHAVLEKSCQLDLLELLQPLTSGRRIVLHVLRLEGAGQHDRAVECLNEVEGRGYLDKQLLEELTRNLRQDLWRLAVAKLAPDNKHKMTSLAELDHQRLDGLIESLAVISRNRWHGRADALEDYGIILTEIGEVLVGLKVAQTWAGFDHEREFCRLAAGVDPASRDAERQHYDAARSWIDTALAGHVSAQELVADAQRPVFGWVIALLNALVQQARHDGSKHERDPGPDQESAAEATPDSHWPLVAERTARRDALPELARDPNQERQSRNCQGFDPDWWIPAVLAAKWRTPWYPREATSESISQWLARVDAQRIEYLGPFDAPECATALEADRDNDLAIIRQHAPGLIASDAP
jgi:hypothetical protein